MSKLRIVKTATKVRLVNKLLWVSNIGTIEKLFILLLNCFTKVFFVFLFHVYNNLFHNDLNITRIQH